MVDPNTVTLIIALIGCVIGVLSFVRGGAKNAESQGRMMEKLDQVYNSVEELKTRDGATAAFIAQSGERFKNLEGRVKSLERKRCIEPESGTK